MPYYIGSGEQNNIVWWCWLQGEENAPEISKLCLSSLRNRLKNKKIIVITKENMYDYIDFPEFIKEKYAKGIISNTHFSDLLRCKLLITHGGTWIDSTVLATGIGDYIFNKHLFVFRGNGVYDESTKISSWLISSEKNNPILTATFDLLAMYWEKIIN